MKKQNKKIMILIIMLILLDQISKISIILLNKEIPIFQNTIILKVIKKGNIDITNNVTHILISIIAIIVITKYILSNNKFIRKDSRTILSFAVAGIVSNSIDRIIRGNIVNIIEFSKNISLNLSYIYIILAWIGFIIILIKNSTKGVEEE